MSRELYACAYAAEFPAQALLRLRADLKSRPVAVLEGRASQEAVCALNRPARLRGVATGMTRLEAEGMEGLTLLLRSAESETAAREVFLECAAHFSPRIEEAGAGTACALVLDIAGTERLFGPSERLAGRLHAALAAAGFRVSIAVSTNYHAARMKAAATRGITVIPEGAEARALEKLPIAALEPAQEHQETFALWGMRTLGELAGAPEDELVSRLGARARVWWLLAQGAAAHAFQPIEPVLSLREFCEFETPVEQMDSLLFIGARMIDCLVARVAARALSLVVLTVDMKMEAERVHRRVLRPAVPTTDRQFLLKLLQLEIAAHPPPAAVVALTLAAEAGQSSQVQLGLFAPQTPEPSRLDVTLARLKAMVGEDRVGSPVLEDTHRADGFRMEGFGMAGKPFAPEAEPARIALRRVRPPRPVRVELRELKPAVFRDGENRFEITAAYGPWRTSGCWWALDEWNAEEWDVLAVRAERHSSGAEARPLPCAGIVQCTSFSADLAGSHGSSVVCLLVWDRTRNAWRLEAFYD